MVLGLIQAAFCEGHLAEECAWQNIFLIPKGNGNFHGIRLVKILWKTDMGILNCRLTAEIQFHNMLHRLRMGRCTGTASLKKIFSNILWR